MFVFSQSRRRILPQRWPFFLRRWRISGEDEGFFTFSSSSPKILGLRQCYHCILMSEAPTLSICGHTNEGIPSTEHVHLLHWACADIIMRGNPLTDMTDNTEDVNTNWQCLHTRQPSSHSIPASPWLNWLSVTSHCPLATYTFTWGFTFHQVSKHFFASSYDSSWWIFG